jgi:hypothetical protein
MKLNPRWGRLTRAVKAWWRNEEPTPPDCSQFEHALKLIAEYHDTYAKRVGTMTQYARQAAMIVETEGIKRAPTLEAEVRLLALSMEQLILHLGYLEDRRRMLEGR